MKLAERNPQPPKVTRPEPPREHPHRKLSAIYPPPAVYFSGLSGHSLRSRGDHTKAIKGKTNKKIFRNRLFWFSAIAPIILGLHMANVPEFLTRPYLGRAFDLSGKSGLKSAETQPL